MIREFWWQYERADAWKEGLDWVRAVENEQQKFHLRNLQFDWLYNADDSPGLGWGLSRSVTAAPDRTIPTDNVVRSGIDTAASIIARQRPRPVVLTSGADWETRQRAKKETQFIEGFLREYNAWDTGPMIFRDAGIYGTGAWKFCRGYGAEKPFGIERALIDDVIVNEKECRTTLMPRTLAHRHFVHKEVLASIFPEARQFIMRAAETDRDWTAIRRIPDEMVCVVELWHLPSGPDAGDGRFMTAIDGATLVYEEYTKKTFPFVFYMWSPPTSGFYGRGIAHELAPIQLRLNQVNRFINLSQDHYAVPRLIVDRGALLTERLSNRIGEITEKRPGSQIMPLVMNAVNPEMYEYRRELIRSAFEKIGISQLSAQALKPAGLESAVALREYNDIETQRFAIQAMRYEKMYIDLAHKVIEFAADAYSDGEGYDTESTWQSHNGVESINWSEVRPEDDCYCITVEASTMLSRTPSARIQAVGELTDRGVISQDKAVDMLDLPDLREEKSMVSAFINNADWKLSKVFKGGTAPPSPFDNLGVYIDRFKRGLANAEAEGAPEAILNRLRNHIEQAVALATPTEQPVEAALPPGEVPPMGPGPEAGPPMPPQMAGVPTPEAA